MSVISNGYEWHVSRECLISLCTNLPPRPATHSPIYKCSVSQYRCGISLLKTIDFAVLCIVRSEQRRRAWYKIPSWWTLQMEPQAHLNIRQTHIPSTSLIFCPLILNPPLKMTIYFNATGLQEAKGKSAPANQDTPANPPSTLRVGLLVQFISLTKSTWA